MRPFLRQRGDGGATLTEYALLVALIVVVSLGAIQAVQENGEERLSATDARVTADDGAYYPGGATTSTTSGATTTTVGGTIGVHLASSPAVSVVDDGNRWQVTITFTLLDSSNNGLIGATMNGSWTNAGGGSVPVSSCTTSTGAGKCTVQFTKIKDSTTTVTYTLSTITGGTFSWTPVAAGEGEVSASCGSFC